MAQYVTGIIQEIQPKTVTGGKTAYDIVVGGEKYGYGLYKPKAKEGDYVRFELDDSRGYKNVARNSLKVSANKPPPEVVEQAKATAPQKNADGTSFDARQDSIVRQSSLNYAIAYLAVLAQADALGLPAASAKGKRMEVMDTLLSKYTETFYEQNTGLKYKSIAPSGGEQGEDEAQEEDKAPFDEAPADDEWA